MNEKFYLAIVFCFALVVGCSTSGVRDVTELGDVEVAKHAARNFSLSGGRECRVRLTPLAAADEVLVEIVVLGRDAQGDLHVIARPSTRARFGEKVALPIEGGGVTLTPRRTP